MARSQGGGVRQVIDAATGNRERKRRAYHATYKRGRDLEEGGAHEGFFAMTKGSFFQGNRGILLLYLALTASLSVNVTLIRRYERAAHPSAVEPGVRLGTSLRPFTIVDKNGDESQLAFSGSKPTVLYILAPGCGWCQRNQANMTSLASQQGGQYRFVALSTTDYKLKEFWKTTTLQIPVYSVASSDVLSNYHFTDETPQMAVVANDGMIKRVWHGALTTDNLTDAENYFGVKLPGLTAVVATTKEASSAAANGGGN